MEIARLHRELGTTVVYVTHDQVEAMTLADRIVVLDSGRVRQIGTPLEVYTNPADQFVAGFLGSPRMNFLSARVHSIETDAIFVSGANFANWRLRLDGPLPSVGTEVAVGLRPEDLRSEPAEPSGEAAAAGLSGEVAAIERLGSACYISVRLNDGSLITTVGSAFDPVRIGETRRALVVPDLVHIFGPDGRTLRKGGVSRQVDQA